MAKNKKSAVALRYPSNAQEPLIAAKEKGVLAERMIAIARENDVPVVENEMLTNVLSVQQIGQCIPEETWLAVAQIFAYINKVENDNAKNVYKNKM